MTADLTPAQAARLEAIEAAPWAEEAAVERVARAMADAGMHAYAELGWDDLQDDERDVFRLYAVAAIDVMRGATDDGAVGRVLALADELEADAQRQVDAFAPHPDLLPAVVGRAWVNAARAFRAAVGAPATADGDI